MKKENTTPRNSKRVNKKFTKRELNFIKRWTVHAPTGFRMSARELALCPQMDRHTKDSISKKIWKLGFGDKKKSHLIKVGIKKSKERKESILTFLRGKGRLWPALIVGKRFGTRHQQIKRLRKQYGLSFTHYEALNDPVYKHWFENHVEDRISKQKRYYRRRRIKIKLSLRKMLAEFYQDGDRAEIPRAVCLGCGESWPKVAAFFHCITKPTVKKKRYVVLTSICRVCPFSTKRERKKKERP